jgi:hypothetical protein
MRIYESPDFWIWLFSPIWLALIVRLIPARLPKWYFVASLVFVNVGPHLHLMILLGFFDSAPSIFIGLFGYIFIMFLNVFIFWISIPIAALLLGASWLIIWSHPAVRLYR